MTYGRSDFFFTIDGLVYGSYSNPLPCASFSRQAIMANTLARSTVAGAELFGARVPQGAV